MVLLKGGLTEGSLYSSGARAGRSAVFLVRLSAPACEMTQACDGKTSGLRRLPRILNDSAVDLSRPQTGAIVAGRRSNSTAGGGGKWLLHWFFTVAPLLTALCLPVDRVTKRGNSATKSLHGLSRSVG